MSAAAATCLLLALLAAVVCLAYMMLCGSPEEVVVVAVAASQPVMNAASIIQLLSHPQQLSSHAQLEVRRISSSADACHGHGVYAPDIDECRCTAGWSGRFCKIAQLRPCNGMQPGALGNHESLCAGNCDEERGGCYCAGLATPFQRPLPTHCQPAVHHSTRLPDGRQAKPVESPRRCAACRPARAGKRMQRSAPHRVMPSLACPDGPWLTTC